VVERGVVETDDGVVEEAGPEQRLARGEGVVGLGELGRDLRAASNSACSLAKRPRSPDRADRTRGFRGAGAR
jgi:hypothetical protein